MSEGPRTVLVRLYAGVKERAGVTELHVGAHDVASLKIALARACPAIAAQIEFCRFALLDEFVLDNTPLPSGSTVDVIPPVSGG